MTSASGDRTSGSLGWIRETRLEGVTVFHGIQAGVLDPPAAASIRSELRVLDGMLSAVEDALAVGDRQLSAELRSRIHLLGGSRAGSLVVGMPLRAVQREILRKQEPLMRSGSVADPAAPPPPPGDRWALPGWSAEAVNRR